MKKCKNYEITTQKKSLTRRNFYDKIEEKSFYVLKNVSITFFVINEIKKGKVEIIIVSYIRRDRSGVATQSKRLYHLSFPALIDRGEIYTR